MGWIPPHRTTRRTREPCRPVVRAHHDSHRTGLTTAWLTSNQTYSTTACADTVHSGAPFPVASYGGVGRRVGSGHAAPRPRCRRVSRSTDHGIRRTWPQRRRAATVGSCEPTTTVGAMGTLSLSLIVHRSLPCDIKERTERRGKGEL